MAQLIRNKRGMPKNLTVDNSWVVQHSLSLLRKFKTHMNEESCISKVEFIKYLFTYVCKGHDRFTVKVQAGQADECSDSVSKEVSTIGEICRFQDARYVSASEAAWRLFSFPMVEHNT